MSEESNSRNKFIGRIAKIIGLGLVGLGMFTYLARARTIQLPEVLVVFVVLVATATYWIMWKRMWFREERGRWIGIVFISALGVLGIICRVMMRSNPIFELIATLASGFIFVGLGYFLDKRQDRSS